MSASVLSLVSARMESNSLFFWLRSTVFSSISAKTLLFAELPFIDCTDLGGNQVQTAEYNEGASKSNDPVLQYSDCDGGGDEIIGFNHKQGKRDVFAHVCFADGHTEKFRLPRNASQANLKQLTKWLCYPRTDSGKRFDIVIEGDEYKQLSN